MGKHLETDEEDDRVEDEGVEVPGSLV